MTAQVGRFSSDCLVATMHSTPLLVISQYVKRALLIYLAIFTVRLIHAMWQRFRIVPAQKQSNVQEHGVSMHRTQILRGKVSHLRLFPKRHSFVYSYLTLGIPVRSPSPNWLLSLDTKDWWRRGWLSVTADDHLTPGDEGQTLSEKLNCYLRQQVSLALTSTPSFEY